MRSIGASAVDSRCDESANITNLTAEIESFVKIADTDDDRIPTTVSAALRIDENEPERKVESDSQRQSPENNNFYAYDDVNADNDVVTVEKIQNLGSAHDDMAVNSNSARSKVSPVKILVRTPTDDDPDEATPTQDHRVTSTDIPEEPANVEYNATNGNGENGATVPGDEPNESVSTVDDAIIEELRNARSSTPTSTEVENILESDSYRGKAIVVDELHITESHENLSAPTANPAESTRVTVSPNNIEPKVATAERVNFMSATTQKFEIRTIPLKNFSPQTSRRETRNDFIGVGAGDPDDSDVVLRHRAPQTPPRKRRSVKEIIESINKSQSLLRVNQNQNHSENKVINLDSKSFDRNMNGLVIKEYQEKQMFADIKELNNNNGSNQSQAECNENRNDVENSNSDLFKKCVIRNGSNATADTAKGNVEWNPVPKPRRHRHSAQGTLN